MSTRRRSVVSSNIHSVWARWARAMASGPAPSSSVTSRVKVALAVRQASREASDAVAVNDTIGDEAHGAGHDVAAHVPLRRTG